MKYPIAFTLWLVAHARNNCGLQPGVRLAPVALSLFGLALSRPFLPFAFPLALATMADQAHAETDSDEEALDADCELDLGNRVPARSGIFDIRNYDRPTLTEARPPARLELAVQVGAARYSLLVQQLDTLDQFRIQIVRHNWSDHYVEAALIRAAKELSANEIPTSRTPETASETLIMSFLVREDENALKAKLKRAKDTLNAAFSSKSYFARNRDLKATSVTGQAVYTFLTKFLRKNGVNEEERFFHARLGAIHQDFINSLTTKERAFFDYAIFDDILGYQAEIRAENLQTYWRTLDPESEETYFNLHNRIREKLIQFARLHESKYRDKRTNRLFVLEKVQADLILWLKRNPYERLLHYHDIVSSGRPTAEDFSTLIDLKHDQQPFSFNIVYEKLKRRLEQQSLLFHDRNDATAFQRAQELTLDILRPWTAIFPVELLDRIKFLAESGVSVDDIEFVLGLNHAIFRRVDTLDREELRRLGGRGANLTNVNPFSDETDVKNAWAIPEVVLTLKEQSYSLGRSSAGFLLENNSRASLSAGFTSQRHPKRRLLNED